MFHIPQLRMLDGVEATSIEKAKAENLHGYDQQDREVIFKSLLPEEKFIDRRILRIEDVQPESDSEEGAHDSAVLTNRSPNHTGSIVASHNSETAANTMARQYVGALISRVDFV